MIYSYWPIWSAGADYSLYLRGLDGNREITVRAVRRVSLMGVKTEPKAKFSHEVTIEAEQVKAIQHRADEKLTKN